MKTKRQDISTPKNGKTSEKQKKQEENTRMDNIRKNNEKGQKERGKEEISPEEASLFPQIAPKKTKEEKQNS